MWYWIIKVSILSFIFIFLLHYIYSFFISTLTIPKVKDLVTLPQQKYDELFNSLHFQHNKFTNDITDINNNGNNVPASSTIKMQSAPKQSTQAMKDELIKFMKEISHNNNTNASSNAVADNNAILSYSFSR
jgi:uncharacterized protein YdcH (DUF465 family)